jgi:hypothetical protein
MTVKHNNVLNLIVGCLYVSFFGLHVSVILMTIIRSVRAKEIAMQQRFSLNIMGSHYVLHTGLSAPITSRSTTILRLFGILALKTTPSSRERHNN